MTIALRPVLLCLTAVGLLTAVTRSAVAGRNLLDKEGYADCPARTRIGPLPGFEVSHTEGKGEFRVELD